MAENIVDTKRLLQGFAEQNEALIERTRPKFSAEQYRVARPERLARPSSYRLGGRVRKSGLALLHKGERVLSRGARVLGSKRRRKPKRKISQRG